MRAVVLAALLIPAGASADPSIPARARALARQGLAAHASGDYARAIAAFQAAYAIAPSPALLFDLAQAYRLSNDCDDAALMYRRFLASAPDDDAAQIARTQLVAVEHCRTPAAELPRPAASYAHLVIPASITSAPDPAPAPIAADSHAALAISLDVVGAGSLGFALGFAVDAHAAAREVQAAYAHGGAWHDLAPVDARGKLDDRLAVALGIGGAIALAGGVALHLHDRHARAITIAPTRQGARVGVSWTF